MERPSLWLGFALQILVVRWSGCQADVDLTCEYGAALCIDHDFAYMVARCQVRAVRCTCQSRNLFPSPSAQFAPPKARLDCETYGVL